MSEHEHIPDDDLPCSDVLEAVYVYLDGELEQSDCDGIRAHLDGCGPCLRQYGLDKLVKSLVARSCGSDHAPEELRFKVLARLQEVRIEISHVEYRAE
jgi:mycothiol system anti-sigma-R factor